MSAQLLQDAFARYLRVKNACSDSGDWTAYADLFRKHASFVDHHGMGRFDNHDGVLEYITKAMMPYPNMTFPIDWVAWDVTNNAVVFQVQNAFPTPPFAEDSRAFQFPNWTRLVLDPASMLWISEETVYNPLRDAQRVVKQWRSAGGKFKSKEAIKYKYSRYPTSSSSKEEEEGNNNSNKL
jgi:hypothetical protein